MFKLKVKILKKPANDYITESSITDFQHNKYPMNINIPHVDPLRRTNKKTSIIDQENSIDKIEENEDSDSEEIKKDVKKICLLDSDSDEMEENEANSFTEMEPPQNLMRQIESVGNEFKFKGQVFAMAKKQQGSRLI